MYPCERMLGLDIPTQDEMWCDYCGEASETDICPGCQYRIECEQDDV